jgi:glycosyltransferase involved in cell wall biosynthesis
MTRVNPKVAARAGAPRVAMLVRSPALYETRVRKEAETLAAAGYELRVISKAGNGLPAFEQIDGVTYQRIRAGSRTRLRRRSASRRTGPKALARASAHAAGAAIVADPRAGGKVARRTPSAVRGRIQGFLRRAVKRFVHPLVEGLVRPLVKRALRGSRRKPLRNPFLDPLEYGRAVGEALAGWDADVIHAHDLDTLYAAYRYSRKHRCRLVYDSHELELHSKAKWAPSARLAAILIEWWCARAADAVITVSESIARTLADRYRIATPTVLLNSLPLAAAAKEALPIPRTGGIPSDAKVIAFVGGTWRGRGLEQLAEALCHLPEEYVLAIIGERNPRRDAKLTRFAQKLGISSRLYLFDPLPPMQVPSALAAADVCAIPIQNVHLSFDYSMPNKLFDGVMAGIPIAVANLSEMRRFVTENELGAVFDETDPASIARVIKELVEHPPEGVRRPELLAAVQREVAWERQAAKLVQLYERLCPTRNASQSGDGNIELSR